MDPLYHGRRNAGAHVSGLVVFVDSLRHEAELTKRLEEKGFVTRRFVPPLAFSANILPLLFQGVSPDELGFYNEYGRRTQPEWRWLAAVDGIVEWASGVPLLRKIIYRTLTKAGFDPANIPFRLLPYFHKHSVKPYAAAADPPSLLRELDFTLVLASDSRLAPPARDEWALRSAHEALEGSERLFVSLNDLDAISHAAGLDSEAYRAHEDMLEVGILRLVGEFQRRYPVAPVVVLSDHGMAPVHQCIDGRLETSLGAPGVGYVYFLDATLLRIWSDNPNLLARARTHLDSWAEWGSLVTAEERREWGITHPGAGDLIFVLDEGVVFDPNFMGRGVPKAMHGYHPRHSSQDAVFMTMSPARAGEGDLRGHGVYEALRAALGVAPEPHEGERAP